MQVTGAPRPPTGWLRLLLRMPVALYRHRLGALLGRRFVLLHHIGRVTGSPHQTVVEVVSIDPADGAVTVASGFGPRSDWYLNLLAHPDTEIQLGNRRLSVRAAALDEQQAGEQMADYADRHRLAARELCRFMGMRVDGSRADFEAAGRRIPMLRLTPGPPTH